MYKLKRLFSMNYKQLFETIKNLKKQSGKSYLWLLFDIFYCAMRFEAGYTDYKVFEMYKYTNKDRMTFITRGTNNKIVKEYNDFSYKHMVADKIEFNKLFKDYLGRGWLDLRYTDFEEFKMFCEGKTHLFIKPVDEICGKGIEKVEITNDLKLLLDEIKSKGIFLVEEVASQHSLVSAVNPSSINTLRMVTINNGGQVDVLFGIFRIGNGKFVDNLNQGGLAAPIDVETGVVRCKAATKSGEMHDAHPLTQVQIKGFQIPNYEECVRVVKEAAALVPQLGYLGWDVYIKDDGCGLIEANEFPGHDLYQLPGQLVNNQGVKPHFKKFIKVI